ncbi:hypothetical protein ISN44_As05g047520 [Arabidopsis suecica]|uniref:HMA domain-containing protein n=1 Tax=Arabidopsis suecica TaxID=45249 RepID=A0A8T2DMR2_ARASU|nr:hypothetical protein ISN44_As05g047520 [Arabidopsis suecica]
MSKQRGSEFIPLYHLSPISKLFHKMQETVVFEWGSFDVRTKEKAMKVVCEFPGVTVIDVKEKGKLKVTGQFDKFIMTKKLKKICDYVDITAVGPEGQPAQNRNPVKKPEPKVIRGRPYPPQKKTPGKNSDECIIL